MWRTSTRTLPSAAFNGRRKYLNSPIIIWKWEVTPGREQSHMVTGDNVLGMLMVAVITHAGHHQRVGSVSLGLLEIREKHG